MFTKKSISILVSSLAVISAVSLPVFAEAGKDGMKIKFGTSAQYDPPAAGTNVIYKGKTIKDTKADEPVFNPFRSIETGTFQENPRPLWNFELVTVKTSEWIGWKPVKAFVPPPKPDLVIYETATKLGRNGFEWDSKKTTQLRKK